MLFIFPSAFVRFNSDFEDLSPSKRLKIYCAGAWHNIVLVFMAFALLYSMAYLPLQSNSGAYVQSVNSVHILLLPLFFFLDLCLQSLPVKGLATFLSFVGRRCDCSFE